MNPGLQEWKERREDLKRAKEAIEEIQPFRGFGYVVSLLVERAKSAQEAILTCESAEEVNYLRGRYWAVREVIETLEGLINAVEDKDEE